MKYVMIRRGKQVFPVIFPDFLVHEDIADSIIALLSNMDGEKMMPREVVSAGDVSVPVAVCSGSSQTLGINSRHDVDSKVITVGHYSGYWDEGDD